jgi:hypothetical protein
LWARIGTMRNWVTGLVVVGLCTAAHSWFALPVAQASCIAPMSCVCESLPAAHVLHARFVSDDDGQAEVEVLEVLATDDFDPVHAGDLIAGELERGRCGFTTPEFASGDEVLALWRGWPDATLLECFEYAECQDACATGTEAESCRSCRESARTACPRDAHLPGLVLIAWDTELDLGEGRALAPDEAGLLGDLDQCLERFPAPPPPPCDDVMTVGVTDTCAAAPPGTTARGGAAASIVLLLLLLCAALFRRRRVPR